MLPFCNRVETKPEETESVYSQCKYLLKIFDHCIAPIAQPWNDTVSSAYHIAFAKEHAGGRKQRDFAPKKRNPFCFKCIIFQK